MEKRSLSIAGHRTSIALEPEFWRVLQDIAAARGQTLPRLIGEIDAQRVLVPDPPGLASALRVFALTALTSGASDKAE